MKQTPKEIKIQENMKPGNITRDGFLGNDKRNLNEIIVDDEIKMKKNNINPDKIAERMEYFTKKAFDTYKDEITVDKYFKVSYRSVRGRIISPFKNMKNFPKGEITLTNLKKNITITWTPLNISMIRDYHFFEGKGSKHRLDPQKLNDALYE